MKAPAFNYLRPRHLSEVFALLDEYGEEAQLLAGGQTLLATLNMRLSEPSVLIDLSALRELDEMTVRKDLLRIGALVTHSKIEHAALIRTHAPLLALAAPHIAHRAIRNRGTFGGSIAYADPAAEWPACALALDAVVVTRSARGERRIAAQDFFLDLYTTALLPGEVIVACELPVCSAQTLAGFDELARRHGDYAIVGLAVTAQVEAGLLRHTRLAFLGLGRTPVRARATEEFLNGQTLTAALCDQAAQHLVTELQGTLTPLADLTNSAETKRHLASVLLRRTLLGMAAQRVEAQHA